MRPDESDFAAILPTPFGDLWYERGRDGSLVPMYSDRLAEGAAIRAYLAGDLGSLTTVEIEFMREAERG